MTPSAHWSTVTSFCLHSNARKIESCEPAVMLSCAMHACCVSCYAVPHSAHNTLNKQSVPELHIFPLLGSESGIYNLRGNGRDVYAQQRTAHKQRVSHVPVSQRRRALYVVRAVGLLPRSYWWCVNSDPVPQLQTQCVCCLHLGAAVYNSVDKAARPHCTRVWQCAAHADKLSACQQISRNLMPFIAQLVPPPAQLPFTSLPIQLHPLFISHQQGTRQWSFTKIIVFRLSLFPSIRDSRHPCVQLPCAQVAISSCV